MQNFKEGKIPVGDNKAASLIRLAATKLANLYEGDELENISFWLLEVYAEIKKTTLLMEPNILVNQSSIIHFSNALDELSKGVPIQYVIGVVDFMGVKLQVDPSVLIPRPETEELVDLIIRENKEKNGLRIIDIGTGSGCIAISLAKNLASSNITAIDQSEQALDIATKNTILNKVRIELLKVDFLEEDYFIETEFDIIVSNPPYIAQSESSSINTNVLDHEPHLALFVPDEDPLIFYRRIAAFAIKYLKENGSIYLEINEKYGTETSQLFSTDSFSSVNLLQDMFGKNRFIKAERR